MFEATVLDQRIEQWIEKQPVPGLAIAVVHQGEVIYARGFGVTSKEEGGVPITPDTLFRIGSVTKPLVGTALMRLVETGVLDLDRPVRDYLPWLEFSGPGAAAQVTLRMLLTHTSGLVTDTNPHGDREARGLEAHVRDSIPHLDFVAPPGKLFSYSNPGLSLAGYLLEVVTSKPFAAAMDELLFTPLGMARTTFDPLVALTYPTALPHDRQADGTWRVRHRWAENTAHHPAGFAMSNVLDLAKFALLHLQGGRVGEQQLLSAAAVAEMHRPQEDLYSWQGSSSGLTFFVNPYKGLTHVFHGGGIETYQTTFAMLPAAEAAVIIVASGITNDVQEEIATDILDQVAELPAGRLQPAAGDPDRTWWPRYTGTYLTNWFGLLTVVEQDGVLTLADHGQVWPLQMQRPHVYYVTGPDGYHRSVGFFPEADGSVEYLLHFGVNRRFTPDPAFVPDAALWETFVGRYTSPVGGIAVQLNCADGQLLAEFAGATEPLRCVPLNSNTQFVTHRGCFTWKLRPMVDWRWSGPTARAPSVDRWPQVHHGACAPPADSKKRQRVDRWRLDLADGTTALSHTTVPPWADRQVPRAGR